MREFHSKESFLAMHSMNKQNYVLIENNWDILLNTTAPKKNIKDISIQFVFNKTLKKK